jgi:WD40 repeat protein
MGDNFEGWEVIPMGISQAARQRRVSLAGAVIAAMLSSMALVAAGMPCQTSNSNRTAPQSIKLQRVATVDLKPGKAAGKGLRPQALLLAPPPPDQGSERRLAVSIANGQAQLVDVRTKEVVRSFPPPSIFPGITAKAAIESPDGKWVVVYFHLSDYPHEYDAVHVYDATSGHQTARLDTNVYSDIKFSPRSTLLAFTSKYNCGKLTERAVAEVWDVHGWLRKIRIDPPASYKGLSALAISPDDSIIALAGNKKFGLYAIPPGISPDPEPVRLTPIDEGLHTDEHLSAKSLLTYEISDIKFSKEGDSLVTVGEDGKMNQWALKRVQ